MDKIVYLCSKCNDCATLKEVKHSNSIKNGNNFGDALTLGLTKITPIERSTIVVVILCHTTRKLKASHRPLRNSMKGHAIAFPNNTSQKTVDFFAHKLDND